MEKKVSGIGSLISYGRGKAKENIGQYWGVLLIILLINVAFGVALTTFGMHPVVVNGIERMVPNVAGHILQIVSYIINLFIGLGMIKMGLFAVDGKKFSLSTMFSHSRKEIWKYVVVMIIVGVFSFVPVFVGAMAFAFIGGFLDGALSAHGAAIGKSVAFILSFIGSLIWIYALIRVSLFSGVTAVDRADDLGPWEMVRRSWTLGGGQIWKMIGLSILMGILVFVSALPLGIGLLWTIPMVQIAIAKFYRERDEKKEDTRKTDDALVA